MRTWYDWEGTLIGKRLLDKVEFSESGCWNWLGATWGVEFVYPILWHPKHKKMMLAHRIAYEEWVGLIAEGLCVCHHCDNTLCVNPAHFFLGTRLDNNRDRHSKDRDNHPIGVRNGRAVLLEEDIRFIRDTYARAVASKNELAQVYKVTPENIHAIVTGRTWKHIL